MSEIAKQYDPKPIEDKWYQAWLKNKYFRAEPNPRKKPYSIVIPPPNVTGKLTMGHVLNLTIQDILVRWRRMQGFESLWLPGMDHAGIATQNVVEKTLRAEGKSRHDLGREKFVEKVWEWCNEYGGIILEQMKKMGYSVDWDRERFTFDPKYIEAVKEIFVRLFEAGLIYKGKYIINWCPQDLTALSDEEAIQHETQGNLWHIKYPIKNSKEFVVVATTRPETMLGDTAVAVHPDDDRYQHLIGKTVLLPVMNREIPVIADEYVDREFGTGVVKVTPAHDPNDFQMGLRHALPQINVMNPNGTMNENAGRYQGNDRFACRKALVQELVKSDLLIKTEPYTHSVPRCQRCDTVVEPYLSEQWFVKMKPLAEPALKVVEEGHIKFYPEKWYKTYNNWMENIRDWCISRQLWWGHRIPAYYCENCFSGFPVESADLQELDKNSEASQKKGYEKVWAGIPKSQKIKGLIVSRSEPTQCPDCGGKKIRQDEDVLDTWFSSWLWPFATMGWPDTDLAHLSKTDDPTILKHREDVNYFYPTGDLVTAADIIFFWVARMIMSGIFVNPGHKENIADRVPFRTVYFTGLIRDIQGRKMSKSLGNSPDPLDLIDKYGADALRFGVMLIAPQGEDILFSEERLEVGRNFMNKLWNASRFILLNLAQPGMRELVKADLETHSANFELCDRWILSRFNQTIDDVNRHLESYHFNNAAKVIYDFLWSDYCDWYIEFIKERLYSSSTASPYMEDKRGKEVALSVAVHVLSGVLRLLHPFAPFITEEIIQALDELLLSSPLACDIPISIMISEWPKPDKRYLDEKSEKNMKFLQEVIGAVRNIRGEMNVPPNKKARLVLISQDPGKLVFLGLQEKYLLTLGKLESIDGGKDLKRPPRSASAVVQGVELFVPLADLIDLDLEKNRLTKEITRLEDLISGLNSKLANESFVSRAPQDVIDKERQKLHDYNDAVKKLKSSLEQLR